MSSGCCCRLLAHVTVLLLSSSSCHCLVVVLLALSCSRWKDQVCFVHHISSSAINSCDYLVICGRAGSCTVYYSQARIQYLK